jgi:TetR/AcrR family transcriptional repressor of nem operon
VSNFPPDANAGSAESGLPTRERLVRTTARMFLGSSYQAVSVNQICAEVGVLKGSFYHYFPSKRDLAIAVIDHLDVGLRDLLDSHERAARGPVNKMRASAVAVDEIQRSLTRSYGRVVGCPLGNLAMELAPVEPAAGGHVAAALGRWRDRIGRHAHDADEVGLLAPGTDPEELAALVLAAMQGMILLAKVGEAPLTQVPVAMHRAIDSGLRT